MDLVAPRHVRSSQTRDQTYVSCIGGRFFTTKPPGTLCGHTFRSGTLHLDGWSLLYSLLIQPSGLLIMVPLSLSVTSEFCISGQAIPLQDLGEIPLSSLSTMWCQQNKQCSHGASKSIGGCGNCSLFWVIFKVTYSFLAVPVLPWCLGISPVVESRGYSLAAVCELLITVASLVAEHGL